MVQTPSFAVAGATGGLGPAIVKELLANNFRVTVLTRKGSSSARDFEKSKLLHFAEVDYSDVKGLTDVLKGIDIVVSTVGRPGIDSQIPLIDAAVAAGVKRFIPSEFGADSEQPKNKLLPHFAGKRHIVDHLKQTADNWADGRPADDDLTLVVLRRRGGV